MKPTKILIVEDDVSFALELEMMLENMNFNIDTIAGDGQEALQAIYRSQPDLMLIDINLPGSIDGLNLAEQIKTSQIPIIFMTAYDSSSYFKRAKTMMPYGYLIKPFDERTLQTSIELAMTRKENEIGKGQEVIFVKSNYQLKKVKIGDIQMINTDGNYCMIQTKSKKYVLKTSLVKLKEQLPENRFLQVHKRYLVQLSKIDRVCTSTNIIKLEAFEVPLGGKYKKDLLNRLNSML